jgi:multiple sugar transport system ATP-binding protein
MVFQNYALYPHMTVYKNMAFSLLLAKSDRATIQQRVEKAADILGLRNLLDRYPRQLSGGQRQRVAMGRAIVRDPQVFLFDEPLSNLDAKLRVQMRTEIKEMHQRLKTTSVYVTHDQIEAMTMADRIVLLRDGVIEQAGAPLELFERPATKYVAGFLGSPSMNFINGHFVGEAGALAVRLDDGAVLALPPARMQKLGDRRDRRVILGLRPEHINRAQSAAARSGLASHSATIELLQPTGSRTYVTFKLGNADVVAELQAHDATQIGQQIELSIDMNRAVLIDPESEKVL